MNQEFRQKMSFELLTAGGSRPRRPTFAAACEERCNVCPSNGADGRGFSNICLSQTIELRFVCNSTVICSIFTANKHRFKPLLLRFRDFLVTFLLCFLAYLLKSGCGPKRASESASGATLVRIGSL